MKIKIKMNKQTYKEIQTLMKNIKELNNGKEIGGWLLGEWKHTEEESKLNLTKFIIPKQEVSGADVEISTESMMDTLEEIGIENGKKIKAHWHIHPFSVGKTNWSGGDEEKIRSFMEPEKEREIFVFLLSSLDEIKARVEINYTVKTSFLKEKKIRQTFDNIQIENEKEEEKKIYEQLQKRINEKITEKKSKTIHDYDNEYYNKYYKKNNYNTYPIKTQKKKEEKEYYIYKEKNKVILIMSNELEKYMIIEKEKYKSIDEPTTIAKIGQGYMKWTFNEKNAKKAKKREKELQQEIEWHLQEMKEQQTIQTNKKIIIT